MIELPPKICAECRIEFVHTRTRCPDCGADLVLVSEWLERPSLSLSSSPDLVLLLRDNVHEVTRLGKVLAASDVAHRVDSYPQGGLVSVHDTALYAQREDVDEALGIIRAHREQQMGVEPSVALPTPSDPNSCPACGVAVDPHDEECPSCELALPKPEFACNHCDADVVYGEERCSACGGSLFWDDA